MVLRLAADFPDALVGVLPPPGCGIGQADQEPTLGGSELPDLFGQPVDRRKKFSVDVQLDLIPGTVADPHGPAGPPTVEVLEGALGEVPLAFDAEHDLQIA